VSVKVGQDHTLKLNASNAQLAMIPVNGDMRPAYLDVDTLFIRMISTGGTSYSIRLRAYFIAPDNIPILLEMEDLADGQRFLIENVKRTLPVRFKKDLLAYPKLLIVVKGSFSRDPYEKEIIPYLEAFEYNFRDDQLLGRAEVNISQLSQLIDFK
jgi:hypothetical protein